MSTERSDWRGHVAGVAIFAAFCVLLAFLASCSGHTTSAIPTGKASHYKIESELVGFSGRLWIVTDTRTGREFAGLHSGSSPIPLTEVPK